MFKAADQTELPVGQPVTSELALNLKTAASLGKIFPDSVLARADQVIDESVVGTFETCPPTLRMSVHRGRPEVAVVRPNRRE